MIETNTARSPLFAQSSVQLELPLDGPSLLSAVRASGRLKLSPDLDVLAWLSERLRTTGDAEGWVRFTLYELGQAVYGDKPTGKHRQLLRASIRRLVTLVVDLIGYDARAGRPDAKVATLDHLIDRVRSELDELDTAADPRTTGALRGSTFEAQFAPWLREQIGAGNVTYLNWRHLVQLSGLAKRLWVLLESERYRRAAGGHPQTWLALGERLYGTLGMNYAQPRQARAALARAGRTILEVDGRYVAIDLEHRGRGAWLLVATRQTDRERAAVARTVRAALAA